MEPRGGAAKDTDFRVRFTSCLGLVWRDWAKVSTVLHHSFSSIKQVCHLVPPAEYSLRRIEQIMYRGLSVPCTGSGSDPLSIIGVVGIVVGEWY